MMFFYCCVVFNWSVKIISLLTMYTYYHKNTTINSLISVLLKNVIEMTTVFHITLRPILILSKCAGLIDISYIVIERTGLLDRNLNSTFHTFLEISRMIMLLICTCVYLHRHYPELHIIQTINLVKFWIIIIAARLSTIRMIKYLFIFLLV